jgi:hypothetical protein
MPVLRPSARQRQALYKPVLHQKAMKPPEVWPLELEKPPFALVSRLVPELPLEPGPLHSDFLHS